MTRKKTQPSQSKRQQITDSSGWTHIIKGLKQDRAAISHRISSQTRDSLSLEEYTKVFNSRHQPLWQESKCLQSLLDILDLIIHMTDHVKLERCVCLGLGSLTIGNPTPSYELAALLSILDKLGTRHEIHEVIFQDPAFNDTDKSFLAGLGYTILEDPEAFSRIDNNTFVFAPHLEVTQAAISLEKAAPPIYIGNGLVGYVDGLYHRHAEETNPGSCDIFHRYIKSTESLDMPHFDQGTWTHETRIYWLKVPTNVDSPVDGKGV